jgi:hypothetical protein
VWVTGEEIKTLANGIDEPVGYFDTATFFRNVIPDIVEIAFRCDTMRHLVGRRGMLVGKAGPTALFHFVDQFPHRFLCDRSPLAPREGSLRRVNGGQNFRPSALALFP